MKMDSDKGYEEYSLTEKIIYKVFKDDIEEAKQHAPKEFKAQDEISLPLSGEKEPKIGAKIGNKVTYSYKIQGEASSKDIKNLSIVLGQRKAPKHIEFSLIGMAVNEDKTIEMPLKEVRPSYKGEDKALVNIKLLKIE
jgi:FKBP-type peptidyl-prolyl cis-trans isomerase (trigger factor)